jgi:hypothetical protein
LPYSSEETFLLLDGFLTALDPQVRLLTLPNFGVNKRHKELIRVIQQESLKEMPPKLPMGNSKERP